MSTNWPAKEERRLVGEGAGGELRSAELMVDCRSGIEGEWKVADVGNKEYQ